jgi:hypothetical protein
MSPDMTLDTILMTLVGLVIACALVRLPTLWVRESSSPLARPLRAWRPDGWPRGVQEEDRDRPWGRSGPASSSQEPDIDEPLPVPVRGVVRLR